jgi:hypothetical protein
MFSLSRLIYLVYLNFFTHFVDGSLGVPVLEERASLYRKNVIRDTNFAAVIRIRVWAEWNAVTKLFCIVTVTKPMSLWYAFSRI